MTFSARPSGRRLSEPLPQQRVQQRLRRARRRRAGGARSSRRRRARAGGGCASAVGVEAEALAIVAAASAGRRTRRRAAPARRARPAGRRARRPRGPRGGRNTSAPRAAPARALTARQADRARGVAGDVRAAPRAPRRRAGPASRASRRRPLAAIVTRPARFELGRWPETVDGATPDPHRQRTRRQRRPAQQLLEHPRAGPVGERGGDVGEVGHVVPGYARDVSAGAETSRAYRRPPCCSPPPSPIPAPPGPYGTMAWLRATVSRFANGETHARRRALVEALLADLDPAELREARRGARAQRLIGLCHDATLLLARPTRAYVPSRCSPTRSASAATVAPTRRRRHARRRRRLPPAHRRARRRRGARPAARAAPRRRRRRSSPQRVAILVQACEATAALVRGE